jgi:hypothetical protein
MELIRFSVNDIVYGTDDGVFRDDRIEKDNILMYENEKNRKDLEEFFLILSTCHNAINENSIKDIELMDIDLNESKENKNSENIEVNNDNIEGENHYNIEEVKNEEIENSIEETNNNNIEESNNNNIEGLKNDNIELKNDKEKDENIEEIKNNINDEKKDNFEKVKNDNIDKENNSIVKELKITQPTSFVNASSSDERALLKSAKQFGYEFLNSTQYYYLIKIKGKEKKIKVLFNIPFIPSRSMSTIILENEKGEVLVYMKGSDTVIQKLLSKNSNFTKKSENILKEFSQSLRCMMFAKKVVSIEEFNLWFDELHKIYKVNEHSEISQSDFEKLVHDHYALIERDCEFVGFTGIDDKIQDEVPETIEKLQKANIKSK